MKNENRTNIKIKHTERTSKQKTAFRKRVACVVVATVMAFDAMSIMPFSGLNIKFPKFPSLFSSNIEATAATVTYSFDNGTSEYDISNTISITSVADFCKFSCWYNTYADAQSLNNSCVTLDLQLSGANYWDLYGTYTYQLGGTDTACQFYSLGTEDNPFYGVVKITGTNVNRFYSPVPLFDYVDQRTKITDASGTATKNIELLCCERDGETPASSVPLLANYVVNPTDESTAFSADVTLSYFDSAWNDYTNSSAKDFAGIIGEIGTESQAAMTALTVANNANGNSHAANVSKSGTVGLLCQKVNDDSILNETINTGTNTTYSVNATASYYAGGLVGEMASGSALTVSGTGLNNVTQTVTGNYAGGIVGYAEDAQIGTIGDGFKTTSTTVNGTQSSGYVFGYYENTADSRTFQITWSDSPGTISLTSQNSGGLFGILKNTSTTGAVISIDGGKTVDSTTVSSLSSGAKTFNVTVSNSKDVYQKGGVIGQYYTSSLKNTLDIQNCAVYITKLGIWTAAVASSEESVKTIPALMRMSNSPTFILRPQMIAMAEVLLALLVKRLTQEHL